MTVAMQTMQEGSVRHWSSGKLAIRAQRTAMAAQEAATRDPLTGLTNRLGLERAAPELNEQARCAGELGLVLIDVDWFKGVNDAAGHAAGDATLREIAQVLRGQCRTTDLVARWAGDEFVVVLAGPEATGTSGRDGGTDPHAVDRHDWTSVLGASGARRSASGSRPATASSTAVRLGRRRPLPGQAERPQPGRGSLRIRCARTGRRSDPQRPSRRRRRAEQIGT